MIKAIAVSGPTGSGKSRAAILLAQQFSGEIVNCDSIAVYRGFDIGASKPSAADQALAPHHLVSTLEPGEKFDAGRFATSAVDCIREISARQHLPLIVGGSGLYLRALFSGLPEIESISQSALDQMTEREAELSAADSHSRARALHHWLAELDPASAQALHPHDISRIRRAILVLLETGRSIQTFHQQEIAPLPELRSLVFVLLPEREWLYRRVEERVDQMLAAGLIDEVSELRRLHPLDSKPFESIGYRHVSQFLDGELKDVEEMVSKLKQDTRRYAKRQYTWWRHQPEALGWELFNDDLSVCGGAVESIQDKIARVTSGFLKNTDYVNLPRVLYLPIHSPDGIVSQN